MVQVGYAVNSDPWYTGKPSPIFQLSKEVMRPYYLGWVVNKVSPWKEEIDRHVLTIQQV